MSLNPPIRRLKFQTEPDLLESRTAQAWRPRGGIRWFLFSPAVISLRSVGPGDGVPMNPETGRYFQDRVDIHDHYPTGDYRNHRYLDAPLPAPAGKLLHARLAQ